MADELAGWWVHTVTATPDAAYGSHGPVAGDPVTVPCFLDDTRRLVRSTTGEQVVSETTVFCALEHVDTLTPGTPVDLGYRTAEVIGQSRHTAPGLDLPEHLEVHLT